MTQRFSTLTMFTSCVLALAACGDDSATGSGGANQGGFGDGGGIPGDGLDRVAPGAFLSSALVSSITAVECTLSGGTQTTCYKIQTIGAPNDHNVGPFCPRNITDGPELGGLWPEDGTAYDLDGAFIANLATFYNDPTWQLYDPATGLINVTDTQVKCEGAAKPNVEPQYQNHCVECSLDYVNGGVVKTFLLPAQPVPLAQNAPIGGGMGAIAVVGVALNGIDFDPPAPVAAILGAHTIAAFDDCGGHINVHAGYHYHAATGCGTSVVQSDSHADLLGYAMDGYGIYAMADGEGVEPTDLDGCRGHTDALRGYHYHAAGAGENMFIGCFHGEQGSVQ